MDPILVAVKEYRPSLAEAMCHISHYLVTSSISKHRTFSFQPANRLPSHNTTVIVLSTHTAFTLLSSRLHEAWAKLLSSGLETRGGYRATDCFENFPFPTPSPRAVLPDLETLGERLYTARAAFMLETDQGLTKTYNALKDPAVDDPRVIELRRLHEALDRAVLHAYGWDDIPVPPYTTPQTPAERHAFEAFEDEVIDRLFELNAQRAAEEARDLGRAQGKSSGGKRPKGAKATSSQTTLAGTEE